MTTLNDSFVDPTTLSFSSPVSSPASIPSEHEAGPPRKRSRNDMTPEERKEARAHRNRIAAQNSRDRRKAQFQYLEQRVTELEEENRQLRASIGLTPQQPLLIHVDSQQKERELAQQRENQELRERIKTLEQGWDAVLKALAAQGLSTAFSTNSSSPSLPSPLNHPQTVKPFPLPSQTSSTHLPTPIVSPISNPKFSIAASASHSSSDLDIGPPAHLPVELTVPQIESGTEKQFGSTRHLARVATTEGTPSVALQRVKLHMPLMPSVLLARRRPASNRRNPRTKLMTQLWMTYSAKSSPLPLPSKRRTYLSIHPFHLLALKQLAYRGRHRHPRHLPRRK
ncbi:hypothetical protein AX16_002034 [Volvariella volvacea WC 439]|nr:hypothetical protein AX16_002034 [Volvariella volvacea WC 439]